MPLLPAAVLASWYAAVAADAGLPDTVMLAVITCQPCAKCLTVNSSALTEEFLWLFLLYRPRHWVKLGDQQLTQASVSKETQESLSGGTADCYWHVITRRERPYRVCGLNVEVGPDNPMFAWKLRERRVVNRSSTFFSAARFVCLFWVCPCADQTFVNMIQARITWEGEPQLRKCLHQVDCRWVCSVLSWLMIDGGGPRS